jgi:hypothetical protein
MTGNTLRSRTILLRTDEGKAVWTCLQWRATTAKCTDLVRKTEVYHACFRPMLRREHSQ